jgi:hypothetical protein
MLSLYLALKREAIFPSETLISTFKLSLHYTPEDQHGHLHRRGNLKSHNFVYVLLTT